MVDPNGMDTLTPEQIRERQAENPGPRIETPPSVVTHTAEGEVLPELKITGGGGGIWSPGDIGTQEYEQHMQERLRINAAEKAAWKAKQARENSVQGYASGVAEALFSGLGIAATFDFAVEPSVEKAGAMAEGAAKRVLGQPLLSDPKAWADAKQDVTSREWSHHTAADVGRAHASIWGAAIAVGAAMIFGAPPTVGVAEESGIVPRPPAGGGGGGGGGGGLIRAVRDDAYTASRHTVEGKQVVRDLAKGKEAHVFDESVDLAALEAKVWAEGTSQGNVRGFDRFTYTSETPIGRRIQAGKPDVPLYTVEVKGKLGPDNVWKYHMVPRTKAAR